MFRNVRFHQLKAKYTPMDLPFDSYIVFYNCNFIHRSNNDNKKFLETWHSDINFRKETKLQCKRFFYCYLANTMASTEFARHTKMFNVTYLIKRRRPINTKLLSLTREYTPHFASQLLIWLVLVISRKFFFVFARAYCWRVWWGFLHNESFFLYRYTAYPTFMPTILCDLVSWPSSTLNAL